MAEVIHIKLDYNEALQSKKDILNSEMGLLKIAKAIKNHKILRTEELKIKLRASRKLKDLKSNISKLQTTLPKVKIPEILEKEEDEENTKTKQKIEKRPYDASLEEQLQEIREKLMQLK